MIRIDGLAKSFPVRRTWSDLLRGRGRGRFTDALRGVSFEVPRGEFFGLLGQNGAGKTTLFKILATLITPDAGTAIVAGHDIQGSPAQVRQVLTPVIANERSLNWRLTAWENLRLYADLHGLVPTRRKRRIMEVLEVVQLAEAGSKIAGAFSSGMKQRLLIARALLAEPEVLLLDEPTRSLDPISAREFRRFLRDEIGARLGCTILLATHNTDEVFDLCDRVGVLHQGRMLTVASTEALVHQVGERRYLAWTNEPCERVNDVLATESSVAEAKGLPDDVDGWHRVELDIPAGALAAATTLATLHRAGISVARFERVAVSLADVIDRVVASADREGA